MSVLNSATAIAALVEVGVLAGMMLLSCSSRHEDPEKERLLPNAGRKAMGDVDVGMFGKFFGVKDAAGDGMISAAEAGNMNYELYSHLDGLDGLEGNGFSWIDVAKFLKADGFRALTRFYPEYDFHFDSVRRCIAISTSVYRFVPRLSADSTDAKATARKLLQKAGLPEDSLERVNAQVSAAEVAESDSLQIVIEDFHGRKQNARLLFRLVGLLIGSMDSEASLVIFL